jgi:hypothetical protein
MKTIIHINRHIIAANNKHNRTDPPITVKTYKSNKRCMGVQLHGPAVIVYRPECPLACGAKLWIETQVAPTLIDEAT